MNVGLTIKRMILKHVYFVCLSVCVLQFDGTLMHIDHFAVLFGSDGSHVCAKFVIKVLFAVRPGNSSTYKRSFGVFQWQCLSQHTTGHHHTLAFNVGLHWNQITQRRERILKRRKFVIDLVSRHICKFAAFHRRHTGICTF